MDWPRNRRFFARLARRLTGGAACLAVGALTTGAVSLALASLDRPADRTITSWRDRSRFDGEGLGRIVLTASYRPGHSRFDASVYPTCIATPAADARPPEDVVPGWAAGAVLPWSTGERPWPQAGPDQPLAPSTESTHTEAAGWPLLAAWRHSPDPPPARAAATPPSPRWLSRLSGWRPIWAGASVDSALFAAAWLLALRTPHLIAVAVRAARGRCPHCGYSLTGLIPDEGTVRCPECGHSTRAPRPPAPRLAPAI